MSFTFADLGVPVAVIHRLRERGIIAPFPIQEATIADALAGRDVCGRAPTGSGKTLAFGIPLVSSPGGARRKRPRTLVLVPTRELAAQIQRELAPLAQVNGRRVDAFYGGMPFGPQLALLRDGVDIMVATPGRLEDLIQRNVVRLDTVDTVVLDEADRMADMGFLPVVRRLLDQVRADRQTLLFSATLDGDVDVLIRRYQRDPVRHEVAPPTAVDDRTEHHFWKVQREERVQVTAKLVLEQPSTIVFCRTKRGADRLAKQLSKAGVSAAAIHGDRSQAQRERALGAFAAGRIDALVATDVAARGIHVDDVGCVVHYDLPGDEKDYVHRSGRTGRAGAPGRVVTLVLPEHAGAARKLQAALGLGEPGEKRPAASAVAEAEAEGSGRRQPPRPAGPRSRRRGQPARQRR